MATPESPHSERHYAEDEARLVFQRAAARQEAVRAASKTKGTRLTLRELQQIGNEAGIDPAFVAAAAAELDQPEPQQRSSFFGPQDLQLERVLPGSMSESAWEAIVNELRNTFDMPGIASQVGAAREWTPSGESPVRVVAKPEEDMTRLTIDQSLKEYAQMAPAFGIAFTLVSALLGVLSLLGNDINWAPALTFLALAIITFFAARYGTNLYADRQERRLDRILDRLELVALKDAATPTPPALTKQSSEASMSDPLEDAENERSTQSSRRQRDRL